MGTSLQEQLKRIASAAGISSSKHIRGKPSLLFSFKEAADKGVDDIYDVAVQGFDQLCRVDPRFQMYRKALFSQSTKTLDRDKLGIDENKKLDNLIGNFCKILSSYFLLPAAFKVLEYLIRKFEVNERNVGELMYAALPYHATNEFVRLVQTLHLDRGGIFAFLSPMQETGVALPRQLLVQRCLTDRGLLRFVLDMGQEMGHARVSGRVIMPFYGAMLCEVLALSQTLDQSLLEMVFPYLIQALSRDVITELRAAIYMAIVLLASRVTLSQEAVNELVLELSKSASPASLSNVLLVLCHLFASQPQLANISDEAFKSLAKLPTLTTELLALTKKGTRSQVLVTVIATAASRNVAVHDNYLRLLQDIVLLVPLGPAALDVANQLMDLASNATVKSEQGSRVIAALKILDQRYPEASDKAMQLALERFKATGKEGISDASTSTASRERLLEMLQNAFHDSVRAPLLEAGTSLAIAVDAASAGIRRMALEKLDTLAEKDSEALNVLMGSLVRRLTDENASVVQTALSLKSMSKLPPAAVFECLSLTLSSSLTSALKPITKKANRADARGIAIKILKYLAGSFIKDNPERREAIAEQLMTAMLAATHTRRVAFTAVECACSIDHPLMNGLKDAKILAHDQATKSSGWTWKEYNEKTHNREVILALGRQAAKDSKALISLIALLRSPIKIVQQMSLLAANVAMSLQRKSKDSTVALEVIKWFTTEGHAYRQEGGMHLEDTSQYPKPTNGKPLAFESETGMIDVEEVEGMFIDGDSQWAQLQAIVVQNALDQIQTAVFSELDPKDLTHLFSLLAQLPSSTWQRQVETLVQRISEVLDINEFLVDIWASPPEDKSIPAAIESVALKEWVRRTCGPDANDAELQPVKKKAQGRKTASTPAGRKVSGKQKNVAVDVQADNQAVDGTRHANKDGVVNALPFLLVAISSPQRDVRTASLAGVTELANKADIWWPVKNEEEGIPCGDHMISRDCVVGLLKALSSQTHLIEGEGDVGEVLLRSTFEYAATRSKTVEASPKKGKSSQKKSGHAVSSSSDLLTSPLQLRIRDATAIMTWLVNRIPLMRSPAGLHAASYIIRLVHDCYPPQMLLISAQQLLKSLLCRDGAFPVNKSLAVRKVQTSLEYRLATELVGLYNDASLVPLFQDTKLRHEAEEGLSILLEAMSSPNKRDGPENLQAQAIKAATPALFNVLPQNEKARLLTTLLAVKSLDLEEDCRQLATLTLASLPLMADDMIPLINKAFSSSPLNPRKHQRQGTTKARDMGTDPVDAEYSDIQRYIWLAEFLQWRLEDIGGSLSLVKSVQTLVADLLARCQSATDEGAESERAHRLYALQLTVGILQSLAYQHADDKADTHMQVFDIDLAISCAQFPFDVAVRSESLRLIGILASSMPQAVLGHVLKVVTLLENASSLGDFIDAHSINLASETLTAVGKAWIKEGRDAGELVMTVVGATIKAHAIQQLPLLRALEKALRESDVPSTSHVIFGLLSRTTLLPPTVDQEITDKEADKVLISLAKRLLQKHGVKAQFRALAELLEFSMGPTKDVSNDPCSPITLLVFRFASTRLSALRSEIITKNNDASNLPYLDYVDGGVQDECEVLMLKGLQQLQKVVEKQNQERAAAPTPAAAADDDESSWGLETAADAGYSLIECLRYVLHPAAYISGLTTIITKTEDAIQRKALRMLDAVVRQLSTVSSDGRPELSNERVKVAARDAVRCVQSILLSQKRGVEDGPSELTMQLALTVLGSFAQGIGQWEPDVFLGIIDGVLQQVTEAEAVPLRTGALATVAAVVQGLGLKVLPKLPAIISVVLQTAEKILAFENGGPQVDKPKTEDAVELELVALLSVISSLLHGLGAFIAPNLPQLLSLLFSSPVLSTFASSSKLDQIAALIRNQLPQKVPPRLFLPPMAEWLDAALEKNPQAIRLSIDMMQASISSLDAKSASNFHHLIFGSMMKVLDVRRRGLDAGFSDPGAALVVEKTAASALVELILKLSEGKFKPLFFRMIEWANATQFPEDSNVASRSLKGAHAKVARRVAFLHVINALCESLRSVFTPYFHFLMDLIIEILTMEDNVLETSGEEPSLKKQKKSSIKNTETSSKDGGIQPLMDLNHCRILAVRALHRCFLYDTSGFLDEARFERLMAPLVSQLQVESLQIDDAHRLLEDNCSDNDDILEAGSNLQSFPASDRLSRATICCLSQMALASGPSESRWRPLNHAILMKTRATEARNRLAALQSTYALANALQEEYLPLLPEALPFLAELLEDPEPEIEAAATTTVKMLEELSGEDLKEYLKV